MRLAARQGVRDAFQRDVIGVGDRIDLGGSDFVFAEMAATFAERALYWMVFTDMEPYIQRLDQLIFTDLEVKMIAPTHGMPITDSAQTCPLIYDGLRKSSKVTAAEVQ
jgi:hypothetical protein